MKIVFWMDIVLVELIKSLQWPEECDLKTNPKHPLRRPSPYWIQRKVDEKLKKEKPKGVKLGGVESRWKKLESIVDTHLVLNLESFGFKRSMVSWSGGPIDIKELIDALRELDFVEKAHTSLMLRKKGTMEPLLTTEIIHRNRGDFDRKVSRLSRVLGDYTLSSVFDGTSLFRQFDEKARKRIMNGKSQPREKAKKILKMLIADPLIKLPAMAVETGMSRAETKKLFYDLVHGGLILFEPAINSMAFSDFTLSSLSVSVESASIDDAYRDIMNSKPIADRVLLTRRYYENLLSFLCWSSSYYDVMDLHSDIANLDSVGNASLAWQFRSIPLKTVRYPFLE